MRVRNSKEAWGWRQVKFGSSEIGSGYGRERDRSGIVEVLCSEVRYRGGFVWCGDVLVRSCKVGVWSAWNAGRCGIKRGR